MNLQTIGKFIKEQRKLKGYTQSELAEKIFVSEKTISKWECGNGFPDASLILPLCNALEISANELLSGKRLQGEEYKLEAKKNLMQLKSQEEQSYKLLLSIENVLGYMASIMFFAFIAIASLLGLELWIRIVLISVGFINFVIALHFCLVKGIF